MPVVGFEGSGYLEVRPDYEFVTDPYSGRPVAVVPPIKADLCLIHAYCADEAGNLLIDRASDADLAAKGAGQVIATVEERVDEIEARQKAYLKRLPALYIDYLVEAPHGAAPTSCPGRYDLEAASFQAYLAAFKEGRVEDYLASEIFPGGRS